MSSSPPPSLLTIPLELRWEIFEYVFAAERWTDELLFEKGVIWPISRTVSLCRQLRFELLPLIFRNKTIWFSTLGEVSAALKLAPSTVQYWKKVHIDWTDQRGLAIEGDRWHLEPEPGFEVLAKIPNLIHLSIGTDMIVHLLDTDLIEEIRHISDQAQNAVPEESKLRTLEIMGRIDVSLTPAHLSYTMWARDSGGFRRVYEGSGSGHWMLKQSLMQDL